MRKFLRKWLGITQLQSEVEMAVLTLQTIAEKDKEIFKNQNQISNLFRTRLDELEEHVHSIPSIKKRMKAKETK